MRRDRSNVIIGQIEGGKSRNASQASRVDFFDFVVPGQENFQSWHSIQAGGNRIKSEKLKLKLLAATLVCP
jgi:hypothetical protein